MKYQDTDKAGTLRIHDSTKKLIESKMIGRESFEECIVRVFSEQR